MKQLKEDLKNGKLGEEDKEKLAKQLEQMKEKLQQAMQDAQGSPRKAAAADRAEAGRGQRRPKPPRCSSSSTR